MTCPRPTSGDMPQVRRSATRLCSNASRAAGVPRRGTKLNALRFRHNMVVSTGGICLMPAEQTVSKYLPYLRRYARALTGSQSSGDAYVAATLETLIKEPDLLTSSSHPKVALFRIFTSIWNSVPVNGAKDTAGSAVPAERRISQLTPRPRQAFLLVSLEGFSDDAAAEVLGADVRSFRTLVDEAGRELAA